MKFGLIHISFIGFVLATVPDAFAVSNFYSGDDLACYVHANGNQDMFWWCGNKDGKRCSNSMLQYRKKNRKDSEQQLYHKGSFTYEGRTYWCCGGTVDTRGIFVESTTWIDESKTETFTEDVEGGKCTWQRKYNVCGDIDEAQSEKVCTEPEPAAGCGTGYVARPDANNVTRCVPRCQDDFVFAEGTDNCIRCETTERQGIVNGQCRVCQLNEIFDKQTLRCMTVQEVAAKKLQISALAHDTCWLCVSPDALLKCLKHVTNGGRITDYADLVSKCSLSSTPEAYIK